MLGIPIIPGRIRRSPPTLGQHADEMLGELGYGAGAIQRRRAEGII